MRKLNETQAYALSRKFEEGDNAYNALHALYSLMYFSTSSHEVDSFCFDMIRKLELCFPISTSKVKTQMVYDESLRTLNEKQRRNRNRQEG